MRSRSAIHWALALLLFAAPEQSLAQLVQGHVRDSASGAPIQGALVLLLDSAGVSLGGALTDESGIFRVRAPAPGRYSVRAERIGFETEVSVGFEVREVGGVQLALDMKASAVAIEGLEVEASRRCTLSPQQGATVARLWGEAQKALRNQAFVDSAGLLRFRLTEYERELDPGTRLVISESRHATRWLGHNPVQSLPPDSLVDHGFVQSDDSGGYQYFGPDAGVLLSDTFLAAHCFGLRASSRASDVIGLSFEPLRSRRGAADIEGTLWLDKSDGGPRSLDFVYTWSPWPEASGVANGHVEFEELPQGAWIVRSWWIRMPQMVRVTDLMRGGHSGLRVGALREVGGTADPLESVRGDRVPESGRGAIEGVVWDSTRAQPLAGAEVVVGDEGPRTRTDAQGQFALHEVAAGVREISFRHPRLDSLFVIPPGVEVTVAGDATARTELGVPSLRTVLSALCPLDRAPGSSAVAGVVRAGKNGGPLSGARVLLEWTDYSVAGGREILADVQTLEVATDDQGRYRACGIPPGVLLAARASVDGSNGPTRRVEVPREGVVAFDLSLAREELSANSETPPCQVASQQKLTGWIVGQVREVATGVPVGLSRVSLTPAGNEEPAAVQADASGQFVFCNLAPGEYVLETSVHGLGAGRSEATVTPGTGATVALALRPSNDIQGTGTLLGYVRSATDGRPMPGAEIRLGSRVVRIAGEDGAFEIQDVPIGTHPLTVTYIGYAPARGEVVVGAGQTLVTDIHLSEQAIELDPIVVTAVRFTSGGMLADVRRRAASAFGTVLAGDDLKPRLQRATRTTDLLRDQGVTLLPNGSGLYINRSGCAPHVYLDGVRVTHLPRTGADPRANDSPAEEAARALNMVDPSTLAAIEIYRGPAETPGEFIDSDSKCGLILLWTRRGDDIRF